MTNKLTLEMTVLQCIVAIADGNVGAVNVLAQVAKNGAAHDPDNGLGVLSVLMHLDDLRVYGPKVWQLYKDVCGQDVGRMLAVLRAHQLGFLSRAVLLKQIGDDERRGEPFANIDDIVAFVQKELPDFKLEVAS